MVKYLPGRFLCIPQVLLTMVPRIPDYVEILCAHIACWFAVRSLAEEQGSFDKTLSQLKGCHAVEMQAAAQELQRSSSDGNRAKM